ncbi:lytic transglycosylase domain-containing protein [Marinifilum sp. D737]|uniref:lytic transglycosylase domain-containing protein n=1 Tax=Marinifilum sp. D737 TaxID=2969628 RepID=UPI002274437A|nr:lytic transglycosylase domain-containing protein [Marinifilum sp. D737]MCY1635616.1 transglycosylase SLT domain-containing protein [Marinifilum sp. D737]
MNIYRPLKNILALIVVSGTVYLTAQLFNYSTVSDRGKDPENSEYMSRYNVYALKTPDKLTFGDEIVPINRWDVKESLDRELLVNTYWQSQTLLFLKRANRYFPIIEPILKDQGVPEDFKYLALIESGFVPTIKSPAGAVGVWQFMSGTAKDYGLEVSSEVDERYNIEKATLAACKYLKDSYKKYGTWTLVAASYNAGRRFVDKQLKLQDAGDYYDLLLGEETGRYVFRILAIKMIMENPSAYGFKYRESDLYPEIPTRKIKIKTPVKDFAVFAKENGVNYKVLKYFNPWLRRAYLTNKYKKEYEITLPAKGYINFAFSDYKKPDGSVSEK